MIDEKVLIERLGESEERYDDVSFAQLNEFGHTLDYEYAKGKRDGMAESKEIVKELASEHNNGWISVEDALPKEKGTYLVTVKHFGVTFARFTGQKDNLHFDANVIAWQPLPAPYRKGE